MRCKASWPFFLFYLLQKYTETVVLPSNATVKGNCANITKNDSKATLELTFGTLKFTWMFDVKKDKSWSSVNMTLSGTLKHDKVTGMLIQLAEFDVVSN